MSKKLKTIAFDLGGVIFQISNDTTIFSDNYLETTIQPEMFHILEELSKNKYNKLIIISKAYPTNAKKSKEILKLYRLDEYFNSIIFCEKNEDKAKIAEAMNVDIMIDDKEEVLKEFPKTIKTILFKKSEAPILLSKLL
jgi:hypothetical protein